MENFLLCSACDQLGNADTWQSLQKLPFLDGWQEVMHRLKLSLSNCVYMTRVVTLPLICLLQPPQE